MPDTGNVPIQLLQSGSVLQVASQGTLNILAGGSFQNAGGFQSTNLGATNVIATNGTFGSVRATDGTFAGTVSIGGTAGRWAFGSAALASGTALVYTGLTQIVHADASYLAPLSAGTGAGSATSFQVNPTQFNAGTAFFLGLSGTSAFTGAGTITWSAFGY